jgi:hypothetical protein
VNEVLKKLENEFEAIWEKAEKTNRRGKHKDVYEELERTGKTKFYTTNLNQIAGLRYRLQRKYPNVQIKVVKASVVDPKLEGWVMLAKL